MLPSVGRSIATRLYGEVIRAAQKAGDWREAVLLYREAEAAGLGPSAATATAVFLACYAEQQVTTRHRPRPILAVDASHFASLSCFMHLTTCIMLDAVFFFVALTMNVLGSTSLVRECVLSLSPPPLHLNPRLLPSLAVFLVRRPPQRVLPVRRGGVVCIGRFATAVGGGNA